MTQEQKDLLLKDLCARLPYKPKIGFTESNSNDNLQSIWYDDLEGWQVDGDNLSTPVYAVKPYLFPLSSMTEEHIFEINDILGEDFEIDKYGITDLIRNRRTSLSYLELDTLFEYFNKNHFDYRSLIEKGLAIDATGLNIY